MNESGSIEQKIMQDKYNIRCNHLFTEGHVCMFEGKEVPTVVCCMENGSITSSLLSAMLKQIDDPVCSHGMSWSPTHLFLLMAAVVGLTSPSWNM
jgi:hypothetical protein